MTSLDVEDIKFSGSHCHNATGCQSMHVHGVFFCVEIPLRLRSTVVPAA